MTMLTFKDVLRYVLRLLIGLVGWEKALSLLPWLTWHHKPKVWYSFHPSQCQSISLWLQSELEYYNVLVTRAPSWAAVSEGKQKLLYFHTFPGFAFGLSWSWWNNSLTESVLSAFQRIKSWQSESTHQVVTALSFKPWHIYEIDMIHVSFEAM